MKAGVSPTRVAARAPVPGGVWVLALFAVPFAAAGLGIFVFMVALPVYDWARMWSWQPVPAVVESATLQSHHGTKGGTTHSVHVRYRYRVDGAEYTGTRASLSDRPDNIGSFQETLGRRLQAAQRTGAPVQVWANPQRPAESIADRSLRPGLLALALGMSVVSGGFGFWVLARVARAAWRRGDAPLPEGSAEPYGGGTEPWLQRPEWADNAIRSDQRDELKIAWFMAVVWNAVAVPLAVFKLPAAWQGGNAVGAGAMAVFGLLGLAIFAWAVRSTLNARRFGDVRLVLDPFPGALGGHFGASAVLPVAYAPGMQFVARLRCTRHEKGGRGRDDGNEHELWRTEGLAQVQPAGRGVQVSFRFDVPAHLPASDPVAATFHAWRVELDSATQGLAFSRGFAVPVFATGATSARLHADAAQHPDLRALLSRELAQLGTLQAAPGGLSLYFPAGRRWASSLMVVVFGAVFAAAGWFAGLRGAPLLFPVVFCTVGGAIILGGFYELTNSLRVQVGRSGLQTERRVLGIVTARHRAAAHEVAGLALKAGSSTRSGSTTEVNYKVVAHPKKGPPITLAEGVRGQAAARELLRTLQEASGIAALESP